MNYGVKLKTAYCLAGYFVGNIFGINDSWNDNENDKVFLSKEQVLKLFEDFEIVYFKEIDNDGESAVGEEKHWHYFNIIARKME